MDRKTDRTTYGGKNNRFKWVTINNDNRRAGDVHVSLDATFVLILVALVALALLGYKAAMTILLQVEILADRLAHRANRTWSTITDPEVLPYLIAIAITGAILAGATIY